MSDDFFKFEMENIDFPFYKGKPKLNYLDWILLLIGVSIFLFSLQLETVQFMDNLLILIVILIICRFNLFLIFKKLTEKDIYLICILTPLSILFSLLLSSIITYISFPIDYGYSDFFIPFGLFDYLLQTIGLAIDLIYEELFKFAIFILVLSLVYKLSDNRKMSIICAAFATLVLFGACHFDGYGGLLKLIECIILQGFGSICEVYSYIKTKNVLVSYFIHLLFDIWCDVPVPLLLTT